MLSWTVSHNMSLKLCVDVVFYVQNVTFEVTIGGFEVTSDFNKTPAYNSIHLRLRRGLAALRAANMLLYAGVMSKSAVTSNLPVVT